MNITALTLVITPYLVINPIFNVCEKALYHIPQLYVFPSVGV